MKALLVEDNPADARLIRELLNRPAAVDVQLQHVDRLDLARERVRQETFDVVLLDLGLPDSHGMDTLRLMHQECGDLPIVVLTGLDDERFALEAVRAGAQDYLFKGRSTDELLVRTIRYAVERKRAAEEVRRLNAELEQRVADRTAELKASIEDLALFNRAMVGRELRMIELKREVNQLCRAASQPLRYPGEKLED